MSTLIGPPTQAPDVPVPATSYCWLVDPCTGSCGVGTWESSKSVYRQRMLRSNRCMLLHVSSRGFPLLPRRDRLPAFRSDDRVREQSRRQGLHPGSSRQVRVRHDGCRLPDKACCQHVVSYEPDPGDRVLLEGACQTTYPVRPAAHSWTTPTPPRTPQRLWHRRHKVLFVDFAIQQPAPQIPTGLPSSAVEAG